MNMTRSSRLALAIVYMSFSPLWACKEQGAKRGGGDGAKAPVGDPTTVPDDRVTPSPKPTGENDNEDDQLDDEDEDVEVKLFLKSSDLKVPSKLEDKSVADVKKEINSDSSFFHESPTDDSDSCIVKTIKKHKLRVNPNVAYSDE